MLGTSACAKTPTDPNASTTTTTTTTSSTTTDDTTQTSTDDGTETDETTSSTTTSDSSLSFYAGPDTDFNTGPMNCNPWLQDCPEGEKCVPWASTGGSWNANKCVPVTGDGSEGDPCNYGGPVEATDDCGQDTHCWHVQDVDGMLVGTCTAFCKGTPDMPECDPGTACVIANDGSITLCFQSCDPLLQDPCGAGQSCIYDEEAGFVCSLDAGNTGQGEACDQSATCAPGLACVTADVLPGCQANSCCTALCDTEDVNACVALNLECVLFFEQGMAPMGYETLGVCTSPGP